MSPKGISRKKRFATLGAVGAALACTAAFAAPAQAIQFGYLDDVLPGDLPLPGTVADSQQGNAPMLAWRGEYLRLTGCSDNVVINVPYLRTVLQANDLELNDILDSHVDVTAWSGKHEASAPKVMPPKVQDWYLSDDGQVCVKHVLMSTQDGLARVSQNITLDLADLSGLSDIDVPDMEAGTADVEDLISLLTDLFTENERLLSRQALLGWMSLTTPTLAIEEAPAANIPGGNGTELDVDVKGLMSMSGGDFADYDFPDTVTLPDAWPDMAKQLAEATDAIIDKLGPQTYWDLHDTKGDVEQHVGGNGVCSGTGASIDGVDNCGGGEAFSRVFNGISPLLAPIADTLTPLGLTTDNTIGPFDPLRTAQTLLGDGQITPEDAPMPSTRIDFDILPGGVGHFGVGDMIEAGVADDPFADPNADKRQDYSRNGAGDASPHNLFAPYYTSLIPATGDGNFVFNTLPVSGVDGAVLGRNSAPGFLVNGPYDYWDVARVLDVGDENPTKCLQWTGDYNVPRTTPEGAQSVAVYSDEHGEARANWFPGMGYFFDQLPNLNLGCDLENIPSLGSAQIQAIASYPDEPVAPDKKSNVIPLEVGNEFSKYLVDYAKGSISHDGTPGPANGGDRNGRVVIAHAQDIDGQGFANELVCLSAQAADNVRFYGPSAGGASQIGPWDLSGTSQSGDNGPQRACGKTNSAGNVAFEVYRADGNPLTTIGVVADFVNEGLLRSKPLDFTDQTPPPPVDPPVNPPNNGGVNPDSKPVVQAINPPAGAPASNNTPTPAVAKANNIQVSSAKKAAATKTLKFKVTGRLVRGKQGTAIRLRATGPKVKSVRVRVKMRNAAGKVIATRSFSVAPNKVVVLKAAIPSSAKSISLSAI